MRLILVALLVAVCGGQTMQCDDLCTASKQSWSTICTWGKCKGCDQCSSHALTGECPALTSSGPVEVIADNEVIENLDIVTTDETPGITCNGFSGVTIRNVRVTHYPQGDDAEKEADPPESNGVTDKMRAAPYSQGISFVSCDNILIQNVRVQLNNYPKGPFTSFKNFNVGVHMLILVNVLICLMLILLDAA